MLTVPAFATGISPSDTGDNMCVYDVLSTYTGPANLQAGWQANTIQLKWYNGDTQLSVQSAANNCTYDSGLTIPSTAPTKTGYTFAGWKIKAASNSCFVGPVCGLTSSLAATDGTSSAYHGYYEGDVCGTCDENGDCDSATCADTGLSLHEWKVEFSHGVVKGTASCNSTQPTIWDTIMAGMMNETMTEEQAMTALWGSCESDAIQPAGTFSSSSTGQYCWCHAESYTPTGGSSCNVSSLAWVSGSGAYGSADSCASGCAYRCASGVRNDSPFRAAVFGVAGN